MPWQLPMQLLRQPVALAAAHLGNLNYGYSTSSRIPNQGVTAAGLHLTTRMLALAMDTASTAQALEQESRMRRQNKPSTRCSTQVVLRSSVYFWGCALC